LVIAGLLSLGVAGGVVAQDPTPDPAAIVTHPAHIHKGTCAELDPNPLVPLSDVGPQTKDEGELPTSEDLKGSLSAAPVEFSYTEAEFSFDDLFEEAHAINVHESSAAPQNYIACGDIGGPVIDDQLLMGLRGQNDSGYTGVALIEKDGDDNIKVTISLVPPAMDAEVPAEEATPTPAT
jgi:hypothetical protein